MELAVAVRIASDFTGRVQCCVFPFVLEKLIHIQHDPTANLTDLSRLIKMDPALSFTALHLDRVMNPQSHLDAAADMDAVVNRIGASGVDAIITQSAADLALMNRRRQQGIALEWLWRQGLTTALLSQALARELDVLPLEEAYLAGLLLVIGKLALFARTPASCASMLSDPGQADTLLEAEAQVVGSGHGQIGAWLIRRYTGVWSAADAAEYATADAEAMVNALPLTQLVWAACLLAGTPQPASDPFQTAASLLETDRQRLQRLSDQVAQQVTGVANELDIVPRAKASHPWVDDHDLPLNQAVNASAVLSSAYGELLAATDPTAILRVLQQSLSLFLGIDTLLVLNHEPHRHLLIGRFAAGRDFPMPVARLRIPLSAADCLPVRCLATGSFVSSFSSRHNQAPTIIDRQLMAYMNTDGIVCVPFRSDTGEDNACLILGVDSNVWSTVEQQMSLLAAIAAAVSGSLERVGQLKAQTNTQVADRVASDIARTRKIVHEINNPLGIIKNYLNVLAMRSSDQPSEGNELRIINAELNRVTELIRSLTSPSSTAASSLEPVDVNAIIADMISLFSDGLPETTAIHLNQDLVEDLPIIVSDRNRLKQALMNLLKNAMEAMPDGGTIQVRTRLLSDTRRPVDRPDAATYLRLSVCDDGPGIDEWIKNDLFKPHVTSKTDHDGLGLAVVNEAVAHLKGFLLCDSIPGRGTCFHIELPVGGNASQGASAPDPAI